jgi:hypothetical protein
MSEPNRYRLATVADFFSVPAERRADCLHDFRLWLEVLEACDAVFVGIAGIRQERGFFTWIDDGKHDAVLNLAVRSTASAEPPARSVAVDPSVPDPGTPPARGADPSR